jgi:hypothetical protein
VDVGEEGSEGRKDRWIMKLAVPGLRGGRVGTSGEWWVVGVDTLGRGSLG